VSETSNSDLGKKNAQQLKNQVYASMAASGGYNLKNPKELEEMEGMYGLGESHLYRSDATDKQKQIESIEAVEAALKQRISAINGSPSASYSAPIGARKLSDQ